MEIEMSAETTSEQCAADAEELTCDAIQDAGSHDDVMPLSAMLV
jgi:hypothetical protein